MKLYKKSEHIFKCNFEGENRIIACKSSIDLLKSDMGVFNHFVRPLLNECVKKYKYLILIGFSYDYQCYGTNDFEIFKQNTRMKLFTGGILHPDEMDELIKLNEIYMK